MGAWSSPVRAARVAAKALREADQVSTELRIRELFARDAATWTRDEVDEVVRIFDDAPEHLRVTTGPYKWGRKRYSLPEIAGWLHKSRDSVDVHMTNRYAAAWELTHDPALSREQVTQRALELFERDAGDWTPREAGELAAIFNDLPEHLRPTAGPMSIADQSYRPRLLGNREQRYAMPEILEWLTLSHDDVDLRISNWYAEAWLASAAESRGRVLDRMRPMLDHDVLAPGRPPTGITIDVLGETLLGEVDGMRRARRAAEMLQLASTREQLTLVLGALDESLPRQVPGPAQQLLDETRLLIARNRDRNAGTAPAEELKRWHARGYDTHPDFGELGRVRTNVRTIDMLLQSAPDGTATRAARPDSASLSW